MPREEFYKDCFSRSIELQMTEEDEKWFQSETHCHICEELFEAPQKCLTQCKTKSSEWYAAHPNEKYEHWCDICKQNYNQRPVRDHDHLDGSFNSAAHSICNLKYNRKEDKMKIPVFFHNFKGYDAKFIISAVNTEVHGKVSCIPKTAEQYLSVTVGDIVFKDSMAFTLKSLDELVKSLKPEDLSCSRKYIEHFVRNGDPELEHLGLYKETGNITSVEDQVDNEVSQEESITPISASSSKRCLTRFLGGSISVSTISESTSISLSSMGVILSSCDTSLST